MKTKAYILFVIVAGLLINAQLSNAQIVGGNYNENIELVSPALIKKSGVEVVRVFVNIKDLVTISGGTITGVNQTAINNIVGLDSLKKASQIVTNAGTVQVIFSLKFPFKDAPLARVPAGSDQETKHVANAILALLQKEGIGEYIDILVVGNEPMWETPTDAANVTNLVSFTNMIIEYADYWKKSNPWTYEIFVGALNRFGELKNNTIRNVILDLAKTNSKVIGLDLHSHIRTASEGSSDFYTLRITEGFTKDVICTEFSLHRLFVDHISDALGSWGTAHGYSSTMLFYDWVNTYLAAAESGTPKSKDEFLNYFESQSWYPKTWFQDYYDIFVSRTVRAATYGLVRKIDAGFRLNANSQLWVLNAVYNAALFEYDAQGFYETNPLVYPTFNKIVNGGTSFGDVSKLPDDILIYPNPVKDYLKVSTIREGITVEVYNIVGATIYTAIEPGAELEIPVGDFQPGIYLLRVTNGRRTGVKQIMVNP